MYSLLTGKLFTNASVNIKINSATNFTNYELRKAIETPADEKSHLHTCFWTIVPEKPNAGKLV